MKLRWNHASRALSFHRALFWAQLIVKGEDIIYRENNVAALKEWAKKAEVPLEVLGLDESFLEAYLAT